MESVRWLIQYLYLCYLAFCPLCFISVQGERCNSEIATELLQHENWISLNDSEYCFVNDCTIRLKESNVSLSIISNKTTDWIITATNSTDLFTLRIFVDSGYCSLEDPEIEYPEIGYFIFIVVISFIIVSSSSVNTVLHLTIKELRTTSGVIIIGICGTAIILFLCQTIIAVFQYAYRFNGNSTTCAVFKYIITFFSIMYGMLKATYLYHFAFLMYRTYTLRSYKEKNKKLLYCYGVVNVVAVTICIIVLVIIDLSHDRIAFALQNNGYCADFLRETGVGRKILIAVFAIIIGVQMLLFITALTLYCLTNKRYGDTTGWLNNIRVSVILMSTVTLGRIILIILFFADVAGGGAAIPVTTAICVEQVVMLMVFLTSTKSRTKLRGCFEKKETEQEGNIRKEAATVSETI